MRRRRLVRASKRGRVKSIFNFQLDSSKLFGEVRWMEGDYFCQGFWGYHKANSAINLHHKYITLKLWKQKKESAAVRRRIDAIWYKIEESGEREWRGVWKRDTKLWVRVREQDKERGRKKESRFLLQQWRERQADRERYRPGISQDQESDREKRKNSCIICTKSVRPGPRRWMWIWRPRS